MKGKNLFYLLAVLSFALSGCVVRTYPLIKDRIDQDLTSGNQGYLKGSSAEEIKDRKTTRVTQVVEVELHSPIRFEGAPKRKAREEIASTSYGRIETEDDDLSAGNRGYLTQSIIPEISEPEVSKAVSFERYTVEKNDTLQKISQKFYGTSKKWMKIYNVNKDVLKGPNKVYAGQVLNIPKEFLKEPKENLK